MFSPIKLLPLLLGLTVQTQPAMASPPPDSLFVGRWAFQVEHRNLMVLDLRMSPDAHRLIGALSRPSHLHLGASGRDASQVAGPTISEPVETAIVEGRTLHLTVEDASDPAHPTDFDFTLAQGGAGELAYRGAAMAALRMVRVGAASGVAVDWDDSHTYEVEERQISNPTMTSLYDADQGDRQDIRQIDWAVVTKADAQRRAAVAGLLGRRELHTGLDFMHAAFVFQHGDKPGDFLVAHALAMVALKKGEADAIWIATATLDRYLQSSGRPQIFGTQSTTQASTGKTTQEPFVRDLISDVLRTELDVPTLERQESQRTQDEQVYKP